MSSRSNTECFSDGANGRICLLRQELQETRVQSIGQGDPLEEEIATVSSILAWRIPWTVEPGRQQSKGL